MPSSTIITRLSVPVSSTAAMPTDSWNSDRRSRRPSGSSVAGRIGERQEARADAVPEAAVGQGGEAAHRGQHLQRVAVVEAAARCARCGRCAAGRRVERSAQRGFADRFDRRGAVAAREQLADRVHRPRAAALDGAKVKSKRAVGARGEARDGVGDVVGAIVDQRVHRHDMVEAAERGIEHVADPPVDVEPVRASGRGRR